MRSVLSPLVAASALALGLVVVACGDDDGNPATDGTSSSSSSSSGGVDGGPNPPPPDGSTPDGGPPGCTFASYVIGLVGTSTNATASPDTALGAGCADSTSQDEFKSLFP